MRASLARTQKWVPMTRVNETLAKKPLKSDDQLIFCNTLSNLNRNLSTILDHLSVEAIKNEIFFLKYLFMLEQWSF